MVPVSLLVRPSKIGADERLPLLSRPWPLCRSNTNSSSFPLSDHHAEERQKGSSEKSSRANMHYTMRSSTSVKSCSTFGESGQLGAAKQANRRFHAEKSHVT